MRCSQCGHENPRASQGQAAVRVLGDAGWREIVPAQNCERCGAPVSRQRSVRAELPGALGGTIATAQPTGQRAGLRIYARAMAGVALVVVLVAVIVGIRQVRSPQPRQLTEDQLRPGDCLTGSNMGLGTSSPWPYQVTVVPCTQQHLGEVFFSGNAWPQSLTTYPGNNEIDNQAYSRCILAFQAYDDISFNLSSFTFDYVVPGDWAFGDRWLLCVAYKGKTPVNYSIKGKLV